MFSPVFNAFTCNSSEGRFQRYYFASAKKKESIIGLQSQSWQARSFFQSHIILTAKGIMIKKPLETRDSSLLIYQLISHDFSLQPKKKIIGRCFFCNYFEHIMVLEKTPCSRGPNGFGSNPRDLLKLHAWLLL